MLIPEILVEDLLIIPDNDIDLKIWVNENIIAIQEEQPLFYSYISQVLAVNGDKSACTALITFLSIKHALDREAFGS